MLDPKMLLETPEKVAENLRRRRDKTDTAPLMEQSRRRKQLNQRLEELRHESKLISEKIGAAMKGNDAKLKAAAEPLKQQSQQFKTEIKTLEEQLQKLTEELEPLLLRLPNMLDASVPEGDGAEQNLEVRRWGDSFKQRGKGLDHHEIGTKLGIIDFERAGKIAGSRFAVLKGDGAMLEMALIQFMLNTHVRENGYVPIIPPYLVNAKSLQGTGQLPKFHEEVFHLEKDAYYLVPTAEVPVTNLHADEVLPEKSLPLKYVAYSPCFRREAGSYGKDIKGLIRQHQFHKVELVKFTTQERSFEELEALTRDAETILQKLELPYRVIALCSGDIGFSAAKCYDIEVWLDGQKCYREISSCSNCTDFQARRIAVRYKGDGGGKTHLAHTLNGSGLAVGRTLIAILENYSNADGSVTIPRVLRPYLGNLEKITA